MKIALSFFLLSILFLSGCTLGTNNLSLTSSISSSFSSINAYDNSWQSVQSPEYGTFKLGISTISFKGKIFVIAGSFDGTEPTSARNDIWSSSNGINWNREVLHAQFPERMNSSVIEYQNKLWLIGGTKSTSFNLEFNDVWCSTNGIDWECITNNASFSPRTDITSFVFNGKLYITGGSSGADIWSSTNGKDWIQETTEAEYNQGGGIPFIIDNKIYLVVANGAIWSSTNAVSWSRNVISSPINGSIYKVNNILYNINWDHYSRSTNGIDWTLLTSNPWLNGYSEGALWIKSAVVNNNKVFAFNDWGRIYSFE